MTGAVRQIIEVPCSVDALERSEALAQLTPDAARALGVDAIDGSDLDASMGARIDAAIAACLAAYKPRGVYKLFNPATCTLPPEYVEPAIKLVGTMMMFHGQIVYERLRRAAHCALMAVTIGPDNPAVLPENADELDRALADTCAKALVECAADRVNAAIVAAACLTAAASGRALSRTRPMSTRAGRRRSRH